MEKTHLLSLVTVFGVALMVISFAIVPDEYPWYYELLLFNAGLWPWLLAQKEQKRVKSHLNSI
ncbi:MAG TPA: hypothetical protein VJ915_10525 [Balneolaceae bacterium]|nr:hypothetical protein [Balneolaceae bacterium]